MVDIVVDTDLRLWFVFAKWSCKRGREYFRKLNRSHDHRSCGGDRKELNINDQNKIS